MRFLRQLFNKSSNKITKLGRWDHRISGKDKYIRASWANSDHCGDSICKDPVEVQKYIDYEVLKVKKEKEKEEEEKNKNLTKKGFIFY